MTTSDGTPGCVRYVWAISDIVRLWIPGWPQARSADVCQIPRIRML